MREIDHRRVDPKKKKYRTKHFSIDQDLHCQINVYRINNFNGDDFITWSEAIRQLIKKGLECDK